MRTWFTLLFFLTMGMGHYGYTIEPLTVTEVRHGLVTMKGEDSVYQIDEAEAWQVGDKAEVIVRDGEVIEATYVWRK